MNHHYPFLSKHYYITDDVVGEERDAERKTLKTASCAIVLSFKENKLMVF
jgi:hypothetical protein